MEISFRNAPRFMIKKKHPSDTQQYFERVLRVERNEGTAWF